MKPDLEAIKERCEKATEGPWGNYYAPHPDQSAAGMSKAEWMDGCITGFLTSLMVVLDDNHPEKNVVVAITGDGPTSGSNADFIANARQDIPALLAYVEKLERVLCEIYETAEGHVASRSGSRLVRIASMALAAVEGE